MSHEDQSEDLLRYMKFRLRAKTTDFVLSENGSASYWSTQSQGGRTGHWAGEALLPAFLEKGLWLQPPSYDELLSAKGRGRKNVDLS